jgi:hypothetical protein
VGRQLTRAEPLSHEVLDEPVAFDRIFKHAVDLRLEDLIARDRVVRGGGEQRFVRRAAP